jgi:hypothetical protein
MIDRLCFNKHMKTQKAPIESYKPASFIVNQETNEEQAIEKAPVKNPAAVELGRLGGLKGGKARAESLTPEQRTEIAKKAAQARWKKYKPVNLTLPQEGGTR